MKIVLKSFDGSPLGMRAIRKLQGLLAHWADRIGRVVVRLADLNGPKGGVDKACAIFVEVPRQAPIRVSAVAGDYLSALDLAVRRTGRAASRVLKARVPKGFRPAPF